MLVVPARPGPLIDPATALASRHPDEIDVALDDMFGPDPDAKPSLLDACLVGAGAALVVWSALDVHSLFVYVLGAGAAALGTILPLRSIGRRLRRGRSDRRRAALTAGGVALDVGHPDTRELAAAYESLLGACELPEASLAVEARSAAHGALVETAVMLAGGPPSTPDEITYVRKRVDAIRDLTRAVEQQHEHAQLDASEQAAAEREARTLAGEELDELGVSSLSELHALADTLRAGDDERAR